MQVARCGVWVLWSTPARYRAARSARRGGKVYGLPWKHWGEHINVLELRAVINGVLWRLRSAGNIHSKAVQPMNSIVILGALPKGRSASRRLAPLVMKLNSLVVAALFTPLLVYCWTDLNPADEPSRDGQESSARRPWKGAGSDCWTFP